jgi:hypothetical protein
MATLSLHDLEQGRPALRQLLRPLTKSQLPQTVRNLAIQIWEEQPGTFAIIASLCINPFTILTAKFMIDKYGTVTRVPHTPKRGVYGWFSASDSLLQQWVDSILQPKRQVLAITFCKGIKKDLVAAAWHPNRVSKWLEAGVQLEDL